MRDVEDIIVCCSSNTAATYAKFCGHMDISTFICAIIRLACAIIYSTSPLSVSPPYCMYRSMSLRRPRQTHKHGLTTPAPDKSSSHTKKGVLTGLPTTLASSLRSSKCRGVKVPFQNRRPNILPLPTIIFHLQLRLRLGARA